MSGRRSIHGRAWERVAGAPDAASSAPEGGRGRRTSPCLRRRVPRLSGLAGGVSRDVAVMRIVLLGPPGAGKGTQARILAKELGIPAISTGDIFRANVSGDTDLGRRAKVFMDAGDLVPDEITVAMVTARLAAPDAKRGFLLDGFPGRLTRASSCAQRSPTETWHSTACSSSPSTRKSWCAGYPAAASSSTEKGWFATMTSRRR